MPHPEALKVAALPLVLAGAGLIGYSLIAGVPPAPQAQASQPLSSQTQQIAARESQGTTSASATPTPPQRSAPSVPFAQEKMRFRFPGNRPVDCNVSFVSMTEFETINATVAPIPNAVTGFLEWDGSALSGRGEIRVAVAAMRTGNETRDEHMNTNLEGEQYAEIVYAIESVTHLEADRYAVNGTWTLHGVSKSHRCEIEMRFVPGDKADSAKLNGSGSGEPWLRVWGKTSIKMSDFGIALKGPASAKVSDSWDITVNLYGKVPKA